MPEYCKAYLLKELRAFPGWYERPLVAENSETSRDSSTPQKLDDDTVVFLQEDLSVSSRGVDGGHILFSPSVETNEWAVFCREVLGFEIPDWQQESARVREELAASKELEEPE